MLKYYRKYRLPKFVDLLNEIKDDDPAKDLYEPVTVIPTADWRRLVKLIDMGIMLNAPQDLELRSIIAKVEAGNG